jgi:hypothetical protein
MADLKRMYELKQQLETIALNSNSKAAKLDERLYIDQKLQVKQEALRIYDSVGCGLYTQSRISSSLNMQCGVNYYCSSCKEIKNIWESMKNG